MIAFLVAIGALLAAFVSSVVVAQTSGGDNPTGDIAAQIRSQGYQCDDPQSATQDMKASRPDEAVWIIVCEAATYRVRLDPDMAAKVEKIDQGNKDGDGQGH